jgi:hypothetical protein
MINAQEETNDTQEKKEKGIVLDWQELSTIGDNDSLLKPVKFGKFHSFKIKNINRLLYQVIIAGKNVALETPVPDELTALFRLTKSDTPAVSPEVAQQEQQQEMNAITSSLAFFTNQVLNEYTIAGASNLEIKAAITDFKSSVASYLEEAKEFFLKLEDLRKTELRLIILAKSDFSEAVMKEKVEALKDLTALDSAYIDLVNAYTKVNTQYILLKDELDAEDAEILENLFKEVSENYATTAPPSSLPAYTQVEFLRNELLNPANFMVTAPPVQADGDFINFKVETKFPNSGNGKSKDSISESSPSLSPNRNPMNFDFDIPVKGGWKVDFSVGPAFSFGKGAKDEQFYLEESTTDGMSILRERDNNSIVNPGVGAFMHIYRRSGTNVSWGGLFGVGAGFQNFDDANVSFYTGASLILGKKEKIMINAGLSFLKVERLKEPEFVVGNEYTTADFNLDAITEKIFKGSVFVSITYNLTNRNEDTRNRNQEPNTDANQGNGTTNAGNTATNNNGTQD